MSEGAPNDPPTGLSAERYDNDDIVLTMSAIMMLLSGKLSPVPGTGHCYSSHIFCSLFRYSPSTSPLWDIHSRGMVNNYGIFSGSGNQTNVVGKIARRSVKCKAGAKVIAARTTVWWALPAGTRW